MSPAERKAAPVIFRALQEAANRIRSGERDSAKVRETAMAILVAEPLIRVEYLEVVDPNDVQPLSTIYGPVRIAAAVWIGGTRLIDNVAV